MFTFLIVKIRIGFHFRRVKWSNIAPQTIHFFTRDGLISFVADPRSEHCIINITTTRNSKVIGNFMCHTASWKFQHRTTCIILQIFFSTQFTRVRKSTRVGNKSEDSLSQKKKKGRGLMAHAHQKNYTNKYSLHSSHLIPPPLNQASRVTCTINLDVNKNIQKI